MALSDERGDERGDYIVRPSNLRVPDVCVSASRIISGMTSGVDRRPLSLAFQPEE